MTRGPKDPEKLQPVCFFITPEIERPDLEASRFSQRTDMEVCVGVDEILKSDRNGGEFPERLTYCGCHGGNNSIGR
jgi:hypothetical protein